jgi:hypothetical protein
LINVRFAPVVRPVGELLVLAATTVAAGCGAGPGEPPPLGEIVELASPTAPGSGEPNLAVGPDGRVYLSWLEPAPGTPTSGASTRDGTFALKFSVRDGAGWSAPASVVQSDDLFVNWADFPSLAPLPDGSLAAHWLVRTGRGAAYDIHLARSTDGGATWSPAVIPHRDGTVTEHGFVSLLADEDGRLVAVWLDGREYAEAGAGSHDPKGEMTIRTATIGPDGVLADEHLLDGRTCDCCQTAAALTADGPIVAYRDRSADEVRDIVVVRRVGGRWMEPRVVHDDGWAIAACPVNGPAIAAEGRRVAIAWFTAARDTARVRLAFSDDAGASFGAPIRVDDGDPAGRVDVELLPGGGALVSWIERTGDGAEVRVRRVEADGAIGPALTIAASSAERASGFPRMARSGDEVVFAWTEPGHPSRVRLAVAKLTRT